MLPLAFDKTTDTYFSCNMCSADGAPYTRLIYSAAKPAGAAVGTYVVGSSGDLMSVRGNGEFKTLAAASAWKRQDKDPGTKGNDYWLDTTGTTGSGLKNLVRVRYIKMKMALGWQSIMCCFQILGSTHTG